MTTRTRICPAWLLLAVAASLALGGPARADNWPRFRGPNGTGTSADKNIPIEWNEKGIRWKTPLPGTGHSSPVVWGDRVFVMTADDSQRQLLCLDVDTGRVLWSASVPGTTATKHQRNSLASSTPATDGERVYAVFWDGTVLAMHAYDLQGKLIWKYDLGSFAGGTTGAATSPVVYGGLVYLNHDQDKFKDDEERKSGFPGRTAQTIALDAGTGKLAWTAPRATFQCSYSTPFLHQEGNGPAELIVASTAGLSGYDPKTGIENWKWVWSFRNQPRRTVASPVLAHGMVFASCGSGDGERHLIAVRKGDKGDVTKTNLVWDSRKGFMPYVPTLLTLGDHLYFAGDGGIAGCLDAKTGAEIWTERLCTGTISASPILIDGKVYVVIDEGDVCVFPAAPAFKLLARNSLGEGVRATPAVADGRLFIRGERHLFCIAKPAEK